MAEKKEVGVVLSELVRRLNEHGRRLRVMENRNSVIESKLNSIEDAMLKMNEDIKERFKEVADISKDFDAKFMKLENDINRVNKNMDKMAKKSELKELENMVSLFNPITSKFITKKDLERLLEERMK